MRSGFFLKFLIPVAAIVLLFNLNPTYGLVGLGAYIIFIIYNGLPGIYASNGKVRYAKGDMEGALQMLEKAVNTGRANSGVVISYAYLLLRMGQLDKSEEVLESVLKRKLWPNELAGVKSNQALILWKRGRLDEAIEMLKEMYENGKTSTVYESLGYLLTLKGDLDKAIEFNKEAYDYDSSNQIIMDNLGQSYYLKGEYQDAREIYEKLMERFPEFPEPYFYYGCVLMEFKEYDKAYEVMTRALGYELTSMNTITKDEVENKLKELEGLTSKKEDMQDA